MRKSATELLWKRGTYLLNTQYHISQARKLTNNWKPNNLITSKYGTRTKTLS